VRTSRRNSPQSTTRTIKARSRSWPRVPVRSFNDFAIWYTPGVAQPCLDIAADPNKVWTLTNKWNQVAIVTDGTRVLGLGTLGRKPDCPVMEGKSLLFKYLGGVDAFPIPLATKDPEKIIETVKLITPRSVA